MKRNTYLYLSSFILNKKPYVITTLLLGALACLVALLLFWGRETVDLRRQLFLDKAQLAVSEVVKETEDNRFCFSMHADFELPSMPEFSIENSIGGEKGRPMPFYYYDEGGSKVEKPVFRLIGDAFMQMSLRFEFKDIPPHVLPDSASEFEKYIMEVYDRSLVDEKGKRLVDLAELDTLLKLALGKLNPHARFAWSLADQKTGRNMHNNGAFSASENGDIVSAGFFEGDPDTSPLLLSVQMLNMDTIFHRDRSVVYVTSALLAMVSVTLLMILMRFYHQQKKLLQRQKDFVHGMTHEFNTPIANIKLSAQKLVKSGDEDVRKVAGILNSESRKLQAGINLVMTAALIERDELLLQKEELNIRKLLESTIERNRPQLSESGIDLEVKIAEGNYSLSGDAFHLENVIQNILSNAKKHSGASLLEIKGERVNGHIDLSFSDNGRGIPEEYKKRIFDKFESRGDGGHKNGYGLGLYYSKMIIELHGGAIALAKGKKAGSAFTIQLPAG